MDMLNNSPSGLYTIYSVTCIENGKMFIGITRDYKRTKRDTLRGMRNLDKSEVNSLLLADYVLYGKREDVFEFENLGEVESKEEAKITAWFLTLERIEDVRRDSVDGAPEWVYRDDVYNQTGIQLGKLSAKGKEMVGAMTEMAVLETGKIVVDIETRRSKIYDGRRKKLADKVIWKDYIRRRREVR